MRIKGSTGSPGGFHGRLAARAAQCLHQRPWPLSGVEQYLWLRLQLHLAKILTWETGGFKYVLISFPIALIKNLLIINLLYLITLNTKLLVWTSQFKGTIL